MDLPLIPACPERLRSARATLNLIDGKWKIPILIALGYGPRRFKELSREMEGVSAKMLSKELKDLEENGLIARLPHGSPTIAVTYALAPLGKSLDKLLIELREWGAAFRAGTAAAGYPEDTANLLVTK